MTAQTCMEKTIRRWIESKSSPDTPIYQVLLLLGSLDFDKVYLEDTCPDNLVGSGISNLLVIDINYNLDQLIRKEHPHQLNGVRLAGLDFINGTNKPPLNLIDLYRFDPMVFVLTDDIRNLLDLNINPPNHIPNLIGFGENKYKKYLIFEHFYYLPEKCILRKEFMEFLLLEIGLVIGCYLNQWFNERIISSLYSSQPSSRKTNIRGGNCSSTRLEDELFIFTITYLLFKFIRLFKYNQDERYKPLVDLIFGWGGNLEGLEKAGEQPITYPINRKWLEQRIRTKLVESSPKLKFYKLVSELYQIFEDSYHPQQDLETIVNRFVLVFKKLTDHVSSKKHLFINVLMEINQTIGGILTTILENSGIGIGQVISRNTIIKKENTKQAYPIFCSQK